MESFADAFPGLVFEEAEDIVTESKEEYLYLWDTLNVIFKIYKVVRNYCTEYYGLNAAVLIELAKENKVSVEEVLTKIPYIHQGYLNIILEENVNDNSDS